MRIKLMSPRIVTFALCRHIPGLLVTALVVSGPFFSPGRALAQPHPYSCAPDRPAFDQAQPFCGSGRFPVTPRFSPQNFVGIPTTPVLPIRFAQPMYPVYRPQLPVYPNSYPSHQFPNYESLSAVRLRSELAAKQKEAEAARNAEHRERMAERRDRRMELREQHRKSISRKHLTADEKAASRLRLAKIFLHAGPTEAAQKWLTKVVDDYPTTNAADEARRLLAAKR